MSVALGSHPLTVDARGCTWSVVAEERIAWQ